MKAKNTQERLSVMNVHEQKWMEEQLELRRQELLVRMCAMEEEYQRTRAKLRTEREQEF